MMNRFSMKGENIAFSPEIWRVLFELVPSANLGLELDPDANAKSATRISRKGSRVTCHVIPTDEELMIARHTLRVMRAHNATMLEEKRA